MKRQRQAELPRFIVGALATAGASTANGAVVQITFANNVVSTTSGLTNFTADLTGDGVSDIIGNATAKYATVSSAYETGWLAFARNYQASLGYALLRVKNNGAAVLVNPGADGIKSGLVQLKFIDNRINGGELTTGLLALSARSAASGEQSVQVHRLIFDDELTYLLPGYSFNDPAYTSWTAPAVPEPSSLGLLALGAGGLLARRRRSQSMAA